MKDSNEYNFKERQKYGRCCTKELPLLQPGEYVRVKHEHGSKEWKAATVLQEYSTHAFPRSYALHVRGRRIKRNRVALRTDSSKSHAGYANIVQQPDSHPKNIEVVPPLPTHTQGVSSTGLPPRSSNCYYTRPATSIKPVSKTFECSHADVKAT